MTERVVVIYGAGGFAREVAWLARSCGVTVACFVVDDAQRQGPMVNGIPVLGLADARRCHPEARMVGGIGSPATRERLMQRAADAGFEFATLIHPRAEMSEWVEMADGVVICAGNILTTNIRLGRHVQINLDCTIGHDVIMDDYATLAPGARVSGWVRLGRGAYVGTGATIINGSEESPLDIGAGAVIGAGACVTKSVAPGTTVVGVPAKPR